MATSKKRVSTDTLSSPRQKKRSGASLSSSTVAGPDTRRSRSRSLLATSSCHHVHSQENANKPATQIRPQLTRTSQRSTATSASDDNSPKLTPLLRGPSTWNLRGTTCLTIGLHPLINKNIICEGCSQFFFDKLKGNLENHNKKNRGRRHGCQKPWVLGNKTTSGKKDRRDKIYALLAPGSLLAPDEATTQEESPMHGRSLADCLVNASEMVALKSNAPVITSNNKSKKNCGLTKLLDDNNRITVEATARIIEALDGRTSLEEHEAELLERLSAINPKIRKQSFLTEENTITEEVTELLTDALEGRSSLEDHETKLRDRLNEIKQPIMKDTVIGDNNILMEALANLLTPALKERSELAEHEMRLLGQLAVVAFKNSTDVGSIGFLNFPNCRKIQLVCLPRHYKKGKELANKRLFDSRIEYGMKLVRLLPKSFHSELVAALFLEIDKGRAGVVLQRYHNKYLRMNPRDSASFKNFVGMNDNQYIRFMRGLFYFVGMRIVAPISTLDNNIKNPSRNESK